MAVKPQTLYSRQLLELFERLELTNTDGEL